jgi:predicted nucleic acid-binding protein
VRVFLDANVLFSAARSDGVIRRLLNDLSSRGHTLCADIYVAGEARRNLAAKAAAGLPALGQLLDQIEVALLQVDPAAMSEMAALPEKDRPVLAVAARMGCDVLVTGDKAHFGRFYGETVAGVTVHSPRSLAELLL